MSGREPDKKSPNPYPAPVEIAADDAVGVPGSENKDPKASDKGEDSRRWFVALVRPNSELKLQDYLGKEEIETYLATQQRLRITPKGRKQWVSRKLMPGKLFIKCTEKERLKIVSHPFIYRFMTNRAKSLTNNYSSVAVVPDNEIQTLKFMLGQKEHPVEFSEMRFENGDPVVVVRGSLKGLRGVVVSSSGNQKEIGILLDILGCVKVSVPTTDVEKI